MPGAAFLMRTGELEGLLCEVNCIISPAGQQISLAQTREVEGTPDRPALGRSLF